ncbi:MAG TPA: hypothetical protein VM841_13505 [Actinomycetota bacterium]|nr:hypothetical protein [Actinomycetota bacterium]
MLGAVLAVASIAVAGPSPSPAASTPAQLVAEAEWILSMRVTAGPDAGLIRSNAGHDCIPYFSNIAASGLAAATRATGDVRYVNAAWDWLDWYASRMNAQGFVTNYRWDGARWASTGTFDSTDGYAGTFLVAVRDAYAASGDATRLSALWPAVGKAVNAILATKDSDWLTYARPGWPHKYLMDNVEAYEGFRAVEELAGDAHPDARLRVLAGMWAANMPAALEIFWNPAQGGYDAAISSTGVRYPFQWSSLYPIVTAQAWMLRTGLVTPERAASIAQRIEQTHPGWDASGQQSGSAWWPEIVEGHRWGGMSPRAASGLARMLSTVAAAGRAWPYHVGNAGRLLTQMAGEPQTRVLAMPDAFRRPGTQTIRFTGVPSIGDAGLASFECRIDAGSWAPCASPIEVADASDGRRTVHLRAYDDGGARDLVPAVVSWTVDSLPPSVTLTGTPAEPGNAAPVFSFAGSDDAVPPDLLTFECATNAGSYAPCASPATLSVAGTGTHTARIVARDPAGNVSAPATHAWLADGTLPETTLLTGPAGIVASGEATFTFDGSDDSGPVAFECRLSGAPFAACSSPVSYTLGEGTWTFDVRAVDHVGNRDSSPASRTWYVDRTPPATVLLEAPQPWSRVTTARFRFVGLDNVANSTMITFRCSLDGAPFSLCTTPMNVSGLAPGPHTFEVYALDGAGLADPTPERVEWTVDPVAPAGTIATPDGWVLTAAAPLLTRSVSGQAGDDASGVGTVIATFYPADPPDGPPVVSGAAVTCADESRTSCTWTVTAPAARGRYRVLVTVADRAGNEAATRPADIAVLVV